MRALAARSLAAELRSCGSEGGRGAVVEPFRADATATIAALKPALTAYKNGWDLFTTC